MALSQFSITSAKPKAKPYMLSDGDGLHLFVYATFIGPSAQLGRRLEGLGDALQPV
jgi:hypothetical protein